MSVTVKNVGKERIHVKTTSQLTWLNVIVAVGCIIVCLTVEGFLLMRGPNPSDFQWVIYWIILVITFLGMFILFVSSIGQKIFGSISAYYIDTTMYGIGGITIRKVSPEADHIAICKASHELERQILEKLKETEELKKVVGNCD